jgi:dCMP deaminase
MNALANAVADGRSTAGAWIIVTGEPCLMCAKFIHHSGITRVICVQHGYAGGNAGVIYLKQHKVDVEYVDGPKDPRADQPS